MFERWDISEAKTRIVVIFWLFLLRFYAFSFRSPPSRTNSFNRNVCPLCLPQVLPTFLSEFRDKLLCLCVERLYFRSHSFVKSESRKDALLSEHENPSCGVKARTGRVWWQCAGVSRLFVQLLFSFPSLRKAGPFVSSNLQSNPWPQPPLSVCWVARSVILAPLGETPPPRSPVCADVAELPFTSPQRGGLCQPASSERLTRELVRALECSRTLRCPEALLTGAGSWGSPHRGSRAHHELGGTLNWPDSAQGA